MGKVVIDMAMSLDGFVAGPNNDDARVLESPGVTHIQFRVRR